MAGRRSLRTRREHSACRPRDQSDLRELTSTPEINLQPERTCDPAVFGNQVVVVRTVQGGKTYTPQDYQQLFQDGGLSLAQQLAPSYIGFVKFAPPFFPNVDVYAEKGSGLDTVVGTELQNLDVGQVLSNSPVTITRHGDSNQEDITNDAITVWANMPCYRFSLTDNPGVAHFDLPSNPAILQRLLANLQRTKSVCPSPQ